MQLFSEQDIADRYNDFFRIGDYFCQTYNEQGSAQIEIDPALMFLVVVATYDDIARYKEYHLAEPTRQRSNALKRAAYAAKWIMHFNPFIFPKAGHITGDLKEEPSDGLANAMFAIHFAMSNLEQFTGASIDLVDDLYYGLLYDLVYRNIGGDPLILVLEIVCKAALAQSIVTRTDMAG